MAGFVVDLCYTVGLIVPMSSTLKKEIRQVVIARRKEKEQEEGKEIEKDRRHKCEKAKRKSIKAEELKRIKAS